VWEKYLRDGTGGQALNQDAFIATLKKQVQDPALRQTLAGPLPIFFSAVDANADGMIQKVLIRCCRVQRSLRNVL